MILDLQHRANVYADICDLVSYEPFVVELLDYFEESLARFAGELGGERRWGGGEGGGRGRGESVFEASLEERDGVLAIRRVQR